VNRRILEDLTDAALNLLFFLIRLPCPPRSTLFPYTTLFRSRQRRGNLPARDRHGPFGPRNDGALSAFAAEIREAQNPSTSLTRRSEEHTSELQSRGHLVCRLLLEKKNRIQRRWSPAAA